jgi:hypothetical protein
VHERCHRHDALTGVGRELGTRVEEVFGVGIQQLDQERGKERGPFDADGTRNGVQLIAAERRRARASVCS